MGVSGGGGEGRGGGREGGGVEVSTLYSPCVSSGHLAEKKKLGDCQRSHWEKKMLPIGHFQISFKVVWFSHIWALSWVISVCAA